MAAHYFLALCFDSTPCYNCCLKQVIWQKQNIHKPAFSQFIWLSGCRHSLGVADHMHLGEAWTWTELGVSFFSSADQSRSKEVLTSAPAEVVFDPGVPQPQQLCWWPRSDVAFCELSLVYIFSHPNDSRAINQSEFNSGCTNESRCCYSQMKCWPVDQDYFYCNVLWLKLATLRTFYLFALNILL